MSFAMAATPIVSWVVELGIDSQETRRPDSSQSVAQEQEQGREEVTVLHDLCVCFSQILKHSWPRWRTPLLPALGRQRQAVPCVRG